MHSVIIDNRWGAFQLKFGMPKQAVEIRFIRTLTWDLRKDIIDLGFEGRGRLTFAFLVTLN